jgi:hypothetical protein
LAGGAAGLATSVDNQSARTHAYAGGVGVGAAAAFAQPTLEDAIRAMAKGGTRMYGIANSNNRVLGMDAAPQPPNQGGAGSSSAGMVPMADGLSPELAAALARQ